MESTSSTQIIFMIAMNMKESQVTKNTLKDLYAVMDNKQAMQAFIRNQRC